jgi:hypothetical protein
LQYKSIPVLWSAHTLLERVALYANDRALWDVISVYPWYLLGLLGAIGLRTRGGTHWVLWSTAILGTVFGILHTGLSVYLCIIAPFWIATTDGSIVLFDSIHWDEKSYELAFRYLPFVVLSVMLVKWSRYDSVRLSSGVPDGS